MELKCPKCENPEWDHDKLAAEQMEKHGWYMHMVPQEDSDAIEAIISDNYHDSHHNTKKDLIYHCRAWLSKPLVEKNIKRILAIDISAPTATVDLSVRILFDKRSEVYGFRRQMFTKARLNLQKKQDRWLINRVEILEIDRQPADWQKIRY